MQPARHVRTVLFELTLSLSENPNIVYAILRSHQDFQNLATFTLLGGLRDIQKRMLARAANRELIWTCPRDGSDLTATSRTQKLRSTARQTRLGHLKIQTYLKRKPDF